MKQKLTKGKKIFIAVWIALIVVILALIFILGLPPGESESIKEVMKDGVLHDKNKMNFFGLSVNPAVISAYLVSAALLLAAVLIRIFAIPRFKDVPGKFQSAIEKLVEFFADMAKANSSHRTGFIGAYIFSAGVYIFFSTIFELFGVQWTTTAGHTMALPAPIADIASDFDELPSVRCTSVGTFGDRACVLYGVIKLCASGHRGRAVYPAARNYSDLRADDTRFRLLRRSGGACEKER